MKTSSYLFCRYAHHQKTILDKRNLFTPPPVAAPSSPYDLSKKHSNAGLFYARGCGVSSFNQELHFGRMLSLPFNFVGSADYFTPPFSRPVMIRGLGLFEELIHRNSSLLVSSALRSPFLPFPLYGKSNHSVGRVAPAFLLLSDEIGDMTVFKIVPFFRFYSRRRPPLFFFSPR